MQQLIEDLSAAPSERNPPREELRRAAANAVEELDASAEGAFERAVPEPDVVPLRDGRWQAHEPGEEPMPPIARSRRPATAGRFAAAQAPIPELADSLRPPAPEPARPSLAVSPEALIA